MQTNSLELLAAKFRLNTFIKTHNVHVKLLSDNSTTVHGINRMGSSRSVSCNAIIFEIWEWVEKHNIWITAAHTSGKQNVEAGKESRRKNEKDKEWMLNREVFKQIIKQCDMYPKIDLFASRLNTQLPVFVPYRPDPDAKIIDAFSIKWTESFYAFPPFSIIGRVVQKITLEESTGLLIVPFWPTQPWYSSLLKILIGVPTILPCRKDLLIHLTEKSTHPIWQRLTLLVCPVSGKDWQIQNFQQNLLTSYPKAGDPRQLKGMKDISTSGSNFVVNGRLVPFKHL